MPSSVKAAADPAVMASLESAAARNPAAYRLRLATLAVLGDVALTSAPIGPIVVAVAISLLFYTGGTFQWHPVFSWVALAAVVLFVWLARPSFRIEGRELGAPEAPHLHEVIAELRRRLRVPGR